MKHAAKRMVERNGFTLVELLIALAIIGIIGIGLSAVVYRIYNGTTSSENHVLAVSQVQNAGQWISKDALMVTTAVVNSATNPRLTLTWDNSSYEAGNYHVVKYNLSNNQLTRQYCDATGTTVLGSATVAQYITSFSFDTSTNTLTITATVGNVNETRYYQITRRTS
jgi:prepilin-type N-terminal cleavage/methylation domain-containing protein